MNGRKSDDAYYAYLDGKHQATRLIEKYNQVYDVTVYKNGCYEWGLSSYIDDFLKGVKEAYENKEEIQKSGYRKSFPETIRPRSRDHSANKVDVSEIWSKMYK